MKDLLIGSVYKGGTSTRNETWFYMQDQFIQKTTKDYDHVVILDNQKGDMVPPSMKVILSYSLNTQARYGHAKSLKHLMNYFRKNKDHYRNFLILDSDCFPVVEDWQSTLTKVMWRPVACAVRAENFSIHPHPCAFFMRRKALNFDWIDFKVSHCKSAYVRHRGWTDPGCSIPMIRCFPLLRTNVVNLHPLYCGIYGNMFYHHGNGSRLLIKSNVSQGYYRSLGVCMPTAQKLLHDLSKNPVGFMSNLLGCDLNYKIGIPMV